MQPVLAGAAARRARTLAAEHWPLLVVLAVGAAVRVAVVTAYRPALLWTDSWSYLNLAYSRFPVGTSAWQPSGYPLFLRLVTLPGRSLALVTALQHLLGLVTAVGVYAIARRLRAGRALATLAAGAFVLEAYTLRLEQTIASEPLFTLLLVAAMLVTVTRVDRRALVVAAVLLAAATVVRAEGVIAIPVWLLYVAARKRDARAVATALTAAAVPLLLYATLHAAVGAGFGIVDDTGWLLYGRVGEIAAPCAGLDVAASQRPLCSVRAPRRHRHDPDWYVWSAQSPARKLYGYDDAASDPRLLSFALDVIVHRPVGYARVVGRGISDYLLPGRADVPSEIRFPQPGEREAMTQFTRDVRARYFPAYRRTAHPPAAFVRDYASVFHMRDWLVLLLFVLPLGAFAAGGHGRAELALLTLVPAAVLAGGAAANGPSFRFFVPMLPLLFAGGAVSAARLRLRGSRVARAEVSAAV